MEVKTTLKVIDQAAIPEQPGVTEGQTMRRLVGCPEVPTDRVRVGYASYKAGTVEQLHWHPIEAYYYGSPATPSNWPGAAAWTRSPRSSR